MSYTTCQERLAASSATKCSQITMARVIGISRSIGLPRHKICRKSIVAAAASAVMIIVLIAFSISTHRPTVIIDNAYLSRSSASQKPSRRPVRGSRPVAAARIALAEDTYDANEKSATSHPEGTIDSVLTVDSNGKVALSQDSSSIIDELAMVSSLQDAQNALQSGNYRQAIQAATESLQKEPSADALEVRAQAYGHLRQFRSAVADLQSAIAVCQRDSYCREHNLQRLLQEVVQAVGH